MASQQTTEQRNDNAAARGPWVHLVDTEPPWDELLAEWLVEAGFRLWETPAAAACPDLLLVGLPFPRRGGQRQMQSVRARWPGVPVLALSPTFHAGVATEGELARQLGVQGVVALPAPRDVLLAAARRVLGQAT